MKQTIICRCEDITYEDIVNAIDEGYETLEEIKRYLRCGMGLCQGKTCMPLIAKILSKKTGKKIEELKLPNPRPLGKPVPFAVFTSESPFYGIAFAIPYETYGVATQLRSLATPRILTRFARDYVSDEK